MAGKIRKKTECCTNNTNLPEEMEAALRQQGGMDKLKSRIPYKESLVQEARVFNALSDPIRLQILHSLNLIDLCPCLLTDITNLSDSKLSYHLNVLEKASLIISSPRKKWRIYALTELGKSFI